MTDEIRCPECNNPASLHQYYGAVIGGEWCSMTRSDIYLGHLTDLRDAVEAAADAITQFDTRVPLDSTGHVADALVSWHKEQKP